MYTVDISTYDDLKREYESGAVIYWKDTGYQLKKDDYGVYYVICLKNNSSTSLHGLVDEYNKVYPNYKVEDFFIEEKNTNINLRDLKKLQLLNLKNYFYKNKMVEGDFNLFTAISVLAVAYSQDYDSLLAEYLDLVDVKF